MQGIIWEARSLVPCLTAAEYEYKWKDFGHSVGVIKNEKPERSKL